MSVLAPTYCTLPDWDYTLGPEVGELCALANFAPDANQQLILDATFAFKGDRPAAFEVVVVAPRQNIKTGVQKQIALGKMIVQRRKKVIWSAHETSTSTDSFKDLVSLLESHDALQSRVQRAYYGDGREHIKFRSGGELVFKARTRSGGRGLTGDDTFLDEAFALKASHLGSLLPTMLTKPTAQVIYGSSSGLVDSAELRAIRDRGRVGDDRLAYFEWSDPNPGKGCAAPDCKHARPSDPGWRDGCALDDRARWWATNPALGIRITEDSIADLRRTLPPEEFAREILGWWDEGSGGEAAFNADRWNDISLAGSRRRGPIAIAFDVDPNRTQGAIGLYGVRRDGLGHSELIQHQHGTEWIIPRLRMLRARHKPIAIVCAAQSAAAALVPELIREGFDITLANQTDVARACGAYLDAVDSRSLRHIGQAQLTTSILATTKKPSGDAFIWNRRGEQDITGAYSVTLARWGYLSTQPETAYDPLDHIR